MSIRIAITGRGVISPVALSAPELSEALLGGRIGIRQAPWAVAAGNEHELFAAVDDRFDPSQWLDDKVIDGCDPFAWFAMAAAEQAIGEAGLLGVLDPFRTAVVHGTSMGGLHALMRAQWAYEHGGPEAVPGKTMIQIWPNMAAAQLCMRHQLHGPSLTVTTACASSLDALGTAARFMSAGLADVAVVGGTEGGYPAGRYASSGFVPATAAATGSYGMSTGSVDPKRAMLPFDANRSGIVSGEGSAFFMIETEAHAKARGANVLAWLDGYASLADGHHPSAPEPNGQWEGRAMAMALADAGCAPADVDCLVAHATGTPKGDTAEIRAINKTFDREDLVVTGLKGHTGHTGASAGAMNIMAVIEAMHHGRLVNVAGTTTVDPEVRFDVVLREPRSIDVDIAQINAFGFGGQNASVVLSRP